MNLRSALVLLVAGSPADAFVPFVGHSRRFTTSVINDGSTSVLMASETVQRSLLESRLKYEGKAAVATEPEVEEETTAAIVEPVAEEAVEPEPTPEPALVAEPVVAASPATATTTSSAGPADSDPGTRSGDEITTAPASIPTTAEKKAAAAAQRAANREISKKLAAKRAETDAIKEQEKMEALLSKPAELKERAKTIADRVAFSKLLPSAEDVSENAAKFSTSIEKFSAREAANKLALREEDNTELLRVTASGLARTAVDGVVPGIELVDAVRADEELKSVVGDALSTAGEATSALIAPDPLDDGDTVASVTRKAKVAYVALDSIGVAAYASLCGLISYSMEGSPVAESASRAAEGFINAITAIGALGVRSYDAVADAAEKGIAEAEQQQAVEDKRMAEERREAEEARKADETTAVAAPTDEAKLAEESMPANEAVVDNVLAMHEEVKAAMEAETEDVKVSDAPQDEEQKNSMSTDEFQRDLLAARLEMEKK